MIKPFLPKTRIIVLQGNMAENGITGAILTYSRDIYYYTGTARPSILAVTPSSLALFVKDGFDLVLDETWIDKDFVRNGAELDRISSFFHSNIPAAQIGPKLGLELDVIPAVLYQKLLSAIDGVQPVNVSPLILEQRLVKDEKEVQLTRQACRILEAGHERLLMVLREGIREIDLAAEIEAEHRRHLHEGVYFMRLTDFTMSRGPIASGENLARNSGIVRTISGVGLSSAIPAGPSERVIRKGDHVMIDIPSNFRGYHADQSRTYVLGKALPEARELYASLREVCVSLLPLCRDGVNCRNIYDEAIKKALSLGIGRFFLSYGPRKADFIGHGIGLELNEPPFLSPSDSTTLKEGFLITVELPLVHPGIGGLKIEETVLVKKDSGEVLTHAPNTLTEVE
ncbi:MAG: aminopeptidase P family protein [Candidatus Tectomicrobia bacterium]|uniref:Aminopeptidase P family protein n=1 Tax=Tectimicrobiota bacterium TaxID=2528274 RepID=A0A933LR29_UNCTE|nr:aminopeptidase P family protein [Candidatus Tectomicrobia bacterium]